MMFTMVLVDLSTLMVISTSGIGWMVRDLATANLQINLGAFTKASGNIASSWATNDAPELLTTNNNDTCCCEKERKIRRNACKQEHVVN